MVESLLTHIRDFLITKNPNTFQNGFAGGRLYADGKVIKYTDGEGDYEGLGDTFGNYFYIRFLDEISFDIVSETERTVSCRELEALGNFRLVAWVEHGDLGKLTEVLLTDLMNVDFNTLPDVDKDRFSNIKMVAPFQVVSDFEQIYKDETGQTEEIRAVDNVTLVVVDFGLQFNYRTLTDACLDRAICDSCTT